MTAHNFSADKKILLGITGGIAAYKSLELARLFIKNGNEVKVVMTKDAKQFIHPNSFTAITGNPVNTKLFNNNMHTMPHIDLAKWADVIIISPATATTIGKLAGGIYDNLLTTICSATKAKIILASAMNKEMWCNKIVQQNINKLAQHGYNIISPTSGSQACGDSGYGRMAEPEQIFATLAHTPLQNYKALVTAGPTIEPIDPVRFISNKSSGKMGYAIATALHELGAKVTLISGPTHINKPQVYKLINIKTTQEMYDAVMQEIKQQDIFIAVAAAADYQALQPSMHKLKKKDMNLSLKLAPTKDILSTVGNSQNNLLCTVGFAAETDDMIKNAQQKLQQKKLDFIIANKITKTGVPFDEDNNTVSIINKTSNIINLPSQSKTAIASKIGQLIADYIDKKE